MARVMLWLASMMLVVALPSVWDKAKFNFFDIFAVCWLIIGLLRGRKRGMSQELLPLIQWIGIVSVAGLFYLPFSIMVRQYTQFTQLWSVVTAYLLIAAGVHLIYLWFKQMLATKLVEKDPFGRSEFYLGMMAGVVRFGCMLVMGLSLMNSRVATAAELAQTEKFQAANFSDIRFPTYGELQQDVLFKSYTGTFVETRLNTVLIASVNTGPAAPRSPSIAQKKNQAIDDILAPMSGRK
jgi:uncharacterized membrane protein required for colicin V production